MPGNRVKAVPAPERLLHRRKPCRCRTVRARATPMALVASVPDGPRDGEEAPLEWRARASARMSGWKGGSPFQANPDRPVFDRNRVAARRGGEQWKEKMSSVGTRTRFGRTDWRACERMAKPGPATSGRPTTLRGWVSKRSWEAVRWLETEGIEGQTSEAERPARASRRGAAERESEHS